MLGKLEIFVLRDVQIFTGRQQKILGPLSSYFLPARISDGCDNSMTPIPAVESFN